MSELLEKFSHIKELPIFPLPVVLFPGEVLPLHIFEPRYRKMLVDIMRRNSFFGLSFYDPQKSFADRPESGSFGCIAEVRQVETLDDGRSNIVTLGMIRYRLESYVSSDEPYLVAEITAIEDYTSDNEIIQPLANEVHRMTVNILQSGNQLTGSFVMTPKVSASEPESLSFVIAAGIGLTTEEKYEMLESRSTIERLESVRDILKQAIARLAELMKTGDFFKNNGHTQKKLDLN